jgi:transposase
LQSVFLKNQRLEAENAELRLQLAEYQRTIAEYREKFKGQVELIDQLTKKLGRPKKNNGNSHQRSDDITNPPKKKAPAKGDEAKTDGASSNKAAADSQAGENASNGPGGTGGKEEAKRSIGGQNGHEPHVHEPFDEYDILKTFPPPKGIVCKCGHQMVNLPTGTKTADQYKLVAKPIVKCRFEAHAYECPFCGEIHEAKMPQEILDGGLFDPALTAYVGTLNVSGRMTIGGLVEHLEALGATVRPGTISNLLSRLGNAVDKPFRELVEKLKTEPVLNIDETGHKENGKRLYTWGFNTPSYSVFFIGSRSASILEEVLTKDYDGIIGCDYYSAYRAFVKANPNVKPAFCHAHLIRELRYLEEHLLEPEIMEFGKLMLDSERKLFALWHQFVLEPTEELHRQLRECAIEMRVRALQAPKDKRAQAISKRFVDSDGYFTFIDNPGVEPTNNLSERSFRGLALVRRISQGTRSAKGRKIRERLWSVHATCRKQKRSIYEYFLNAYTAWLEKKPAPSLLS